MSHQKLFTCSTAALLLLSGCSFVEDRSAEPVQIVDASDAPRSTQRISIEEPKVIKLQEYQVQANDTLGTIAARTMGSASLFQQLASYNSLDYNKPLKIGQVLLIPNSTYKPVVTQPLRRPTEAKAVATKQAEYQDLNQLIQNQEYNQAIDWALTHPDLAKSEKLQTQLINASNLQIDKEIVENDFSEANFLIQGLLQNSALSQSNKDLLLNKSKQIQCNEFSHQAKLSAQKNDFDSAYNQLLKAHNLNQSYSNSLANFQETKQVVTEAMHQKALKLYRNQQLDSAQSIWDKILVIKPNDDLALVYTDRVKNLKKKLNDI